GAAAGAQIVFGVILGTGVGGGLAVNGKALTGENSLTGEWGHNPLPWPSAEEIPGRPCYCGRTGCLETWLSGPAFEADYERETGTARDPIEIASLVNDGEASALAVFDRYVDRLARGLATVVNLIDPDRIVIGGGLSNIDRLYGELPARIARYAFTDTLSLEVVKNVHGDSSGVRGAAMLWAAGDRP
ncbi:MAG: ROK family protein, partial [Pseudomonadota bacterium]